MCVRAPRVCNVHRNDRRGCVLARLARASDRRGRARPRIINCARRRRVVSRRLVLTSGETPALTVREAAVCHNSSRCERLGSPEETPNAPARPEAHQCTLLTDSGAAYIELLSGSSPKIHADQTLIAPREETASGVAKTIDRTSLRDLGRRPRLPCPQERCHAQDSSCVLAAAILINDVRGKETYVQNPRGTRENWGLCRDK